MLKSVLANWKEKVVFSKDGPQPQVLEENGLFKVVLSRFRAGTEDPGSSGIGCGLYHFTRRWLDDGGRRALSHRGGRGYYNG